MLAWFPSLIVELEWRFDSPVRFGDGDREVIVWANRPGCFNQNISTVHSQLIRVEQTAENR